jgi:hypothetical protein
MTCSNLVGVNCINECSNEGSGVGIFDDITGSPGSKSANFKGLVAGSGASIVATSDSIVISSTGSSAPVQSVFGRTGIVTAQSGDYNIDQLSGVSLSSPSSNQVLSYNGTNFINANQDVQSVFSRTGAIVAQSGDYNINQLAGVSLSSPSSNQVLSYNGTNFINANQDVQSVFGRTGAVVAHEGDYSLTQLSDVTLAGPVDGQLLSYNQSLTQWENSTAYIYDFKQDITGTSLTGVLNTIYISSNSTITLPTVGSGNTGSRIMVSCSQLTNTIVVFPSGVFLVYDGNSYNNFQMTADSGSVEFICIGSDQYTFASMTGQWSNTAISKLFNATMSNLDDLQDVIITSVANNQILKWNGSNWINSNPSFTSDLIFSGVILGGSTLVSVYDYVLISDITCASNGTCNMTISLSTNDTQDTSSMIWDIMSYSNNSPGTWNYVQPRATNNWNYYSYLLYVKNDPVNLNKFNIAFQKGPSSNATSTNTLGYYFNIYNYVNPANYTFNVYTNPAFTSASAPLSITQVAPRQQIINFNGLNLSTANLSFSYLARMNYNIRFQLFTEIDLAGGSSGSFNMLLNGTPIYTENYHNVSVATQTSSITICDFGDAMTLLNAGTLLVGTNHLTFTISSGDMSISNYNCSVILSL